MIITMPVVKMMQMPGYQIVHVIPVWHRLVATAFAVYMPDIMAAAIVAAGTVCRILVRHCQYVLVKMPFMSMMQVPVMQVVNVVFMPNRRMSATRPMNVIVIFVYVMCHCLNVSLRLLFCHRHRFRFFRRMCQRIEY